MIAPTEAISKTPAREQQPTFRLLLRPDRDVDGVRALRRLLKFALRVCRLRCISCEQELQP